jgi:hypothetical protein
MASPRALVLLLIPAVLLSAWAGTAMVATIGTVASPGLAAIAAAMLLARLPVLRPLAAPHALALAQSATSAAAIAAGQVLLLPIAIPYALGRPDLVAPMLLAATLVLFADGWLMWRLFATPAFPATAAWPAGTAAAAVIRAGTTGERHGTMVLAGIATGAVGAFYRAPMAAFGLALFGNPVLLGLFAAGLLLRAHAGPALALLGPGTDLLQAQVPQGMLIGAALVAIAQLLRNRAGQGQGQGQGEAGLLARAAAMHLAIALAVALAAGLHAAMPAPMLALFIAFAAAAALLHSLVVGLVAMHTGWMPTLAAALVILSAGLLLGFPAPALALLAGTAAATGPGLAAMGQALKVAHDLSATPRARTQIALAALAAFALAALLVAVAHHALFAAGQIPPAGHVFAIAIRAGTTPVQAERLALWALFGAALQLAGGPRRHLGLMPAAGMLLLAPAIGWTLLLGLAVRAYVVHRLAGYREDMDSLAAGLVAGDALHASGDAATRL